MTGSPSVCFLLDLPLLKRLQRLLHLKAGSFQSYHQDGWWNMEAGLDSAVWPHWGCVCSPLCSPVRLYTFTPRFTFLFLPFSPLLRSSTRSFAGPGYSSVRHSVRSRRPSSRLSNQDQASPQWDWSSTPAVADGEDEDGLLPELRSSPLPMAMKRALRYEAFSRWKVPHETP